MRRNLQLILTQDKSALEAALGIDPSTARIEVQLLLQQVLGASRAYLLAHPEQIPDATQAAAYRELLRRRLQGEPLAYILGEREFFGLIFKVTPATLIPRPDTELLVELALQRIPSRDHSAFSRPFGHPLPPAEGALRSSGESTGRPPAGVAGEGLGERDSGRAKSYRVLDLGTGSGAIALSIAHARPDVEVTAVDASPDALEVARWNARLLDLDNVRLVQSDWFAALAGERFDMIVSNPPYIASNDVHLKQGDLRFEPVSALASGSDGLDDIRHIVAMAPAHLQPGGWLLFEHGYDQAVRVRELLQQAGLGEVFSARDLAGIERVSGGRAPDADSQPPN